MPPKKTIWTKNKNEAKKIFKEVRMECKKKKKKLIWTKKKK